MGLKMMINCNAYLTPSFQACQVADQLETTTVALCELVTFLLT